MSTSWQQAKEFLQTALECSPDEREHFLDNACAEDKSLRREVENLLASAENADGFMEQAAIGAVAEMLVGIDKNLQISESLNHYRILSHLGAGGMAKFILPTDTTAPSKFCKKLLKWIKILRESIWFLVNNYREMGRYEEAAASQKFDTLFNEQFRGSSARRTNVSLATVHAAAGRQSVALKILKEMDEEEKRGEYIVPIARAFIYAALNGKERTLDWLEKCYTEKVAGMVELNVNPLWDNVRDDSRFQDLLRRVGLPQ